MNCLLIWRGVSSVSYPIQHDLTAVQIPKHLSQSAQRQDHWSIGVPGYWSIGIMNSGIQGLRIRKFLNFTQYSIIPLFHLKASDLPACRQAAVVSSEALHHIGYRAKRARDHSVRPSYPTQSPHRGQSFQPRCL
jgi:hypothetical protein